MGHISCQVSLTYIKAIYVLGPSALSLVYVKPKAAQSPGPWPYQFEFHSALFILQRHSRSLVHASGSGKDLYFLSLSDYGNESHASSIHFCLPRETVVGQASGAKRTLLSLHFSQDFGSRGMIGLLAFLLTAFHPKVVTPSLHSKDRKKKSVLTNNCTWKIPSSYVQTLQDQCRG